jgi:hypothetical protein
MLEPKAGNHRAVNVSKEDLENEFVGSLDGLKPKPELMKLFQEIGLDVWKQKQADAVGTTKALERRLTELRARKDQLVEAFVYRQAIDGATYQEQNGRLAEEIALAEMELHDSRLDELDVEGVLNFAEHVRAKPPRMGQEPQKVNLEPPKAPWFPGGYMHCRASK